MYTLNILIFNLPYMDDIKQIPTNSIRTAYGDLRQGKCTIDKFMECHACTIMETQTKEHCTDYVDFILETPDAWKLITDNIDDIQLMILWPVIIVPIISVDTSGNQAQKYLKLLTPNILSYMGPCNTEDFIDKDFMGKILSASTDSNTELYLPQLFSYIKQHKEYIHNLYISIHNVIKHVRSTKQEHLRYIPSRVNEFDYVIILDNTIFNIFALLAQLTDVVDKNHIKLDTHITFNNVIDNNLSNDAVIFLTSIYDISFISQYILDKVKELSALFKGFVPQDLMDVYMELKTSYDTLVNYHDNAYYVKQVSLLYDQIVNLTLDQVEFIDDLDDVLISMIDFVSSVVKKNLQFECSENLFNLFVKIIDDSTYTKNPYLKTKVLMIMTSLMTKKKYDYINNISIIPALLSMFYTVNTDFKEIEQMDFIKCNMNILIMLDKLCVRDFDMKYYIIDYAVGNMDKFRKIIYLLFENIINVYSKISTEIIDIGAKKYALPQFEYRRYMAYIIHMIDYANMAMTVLTGTLTSDDDLTQIILSDDLLDVVMQFFANVFYNFKDIYIANDWVFDAMHQLIPQKNINMKSYIYSILTLFCKLYSNCTELDRVHDLFVTHSINHKAMAERILQMVKSLDLGRLGDSACMTMLTFSERMQTHVVKEQITYPFEFLDPFIMVPIKHPMILPHTNTIVERKSIQLQLFSNEEHPYTRSPLTLDDVILYSEGEGKEHIDEFEKKMKEWEKNNI
jgi:hypothetical protein